MARSEEVMRPPSLRKKPKACLPLFAISDVILLQLCVTHASQQSFDPSDQGLPLMRRSFDTRMPISIENGLSVRLVHALATLVLVSTYIYLEKRLLSLPRSRGICDCLVRRDALQPRLSGAYLASVSIPYPRFQRDTRIA